MKKLIPLNVAIYGTISILSCVIAFHSLVLIGFIPSSIVWGGNLADTKQLYTLEAVSIILNAVMLCIILQYGGVIKLRLHRKMIIGALWIMFGLFLLNTIGNLAAKNALETYLFTPLTLLLSLFCFRMAAVDPQQKKATLNL